jgi:transcriptional regulator with XRE-family HTH domain
MTEPDTNSTRAQLVAARIRTRRVMRNWTLRNLAECVDPETELSIAKLSKIENGTRKISLDELAAIADALDTTPEHLMRPGAMCPTCRQELP